MEGLSGSGSAAGAAWGLGAEGWGLGRKGEIPDSDDRCRDEHQPRQHQSSPAFQLSTCSTRLRMTGVGARSC